MWLPSDDILVQIMMGNLDQKLKMFQLSLKQHSTHVLHIQKKYMESASQSISLRLFTNGRDYFLCLTISVGNSKDDKKDKPKPY